MITECRTDELLLPTLVTTDELPGFLDASPAEDDVEQDELDEDEEEDEDDEDDDEEAADDDEDDDEEDEEEAEDEDGGAPREALSSARLGSVMLPRLHQLRSRVAERNDLEAGTPAIRTRHLDC